MVLGRSAYLLEDALHCVAEQQAVLVVCTEIIDELPPPLVLDHILKKLRPP